MSNTEQLAAAVRERDQYKHHVDLLIAETNEMRTAARVREAQLVAALRQIAAADACEDGCYYTNRANISIAKAALAAAGAP